MKADDLEQARTDLLALLETKSFQKRKVTLTSGRTSNFYVDCKQTTLDATGHVLVGRLLFEEMRRYEERGGRRVAGVGGLTLGADPIASAASLTSALLDHPIPALIVRKEPKGHGTGAFLEGANNLVAGGEVVVVEDVVTTGGSAMKAVERIRDGGFTVHLVLGLVDRLEGGRENLEREGLEVVTLFDRRDFLPDDEVE